MDLQNYDKEQLIKEVEKLRAELYSKKYPTVAAESDSQSYTYEDSIDISMEVSHDGRILHTNKNWRKILDYTQEDLSHIYLRDIIDLDDQKFFNSVFAHVKLTKKQSYIELKLSSKDGETIYVKGSLFYNNNDNSVIGAFHDVTHQINAEKAQKLYYAISNLTLKTDNLQNLFRNIHDELNKIIEANNFFIAQFDFDKKVVNFPYIFDDYLTDSPTAVTSPIGKGLCEYIYHINKPMIFQEAQIIDMMLEGKIEQFGSIPKSFLGVPFRTEKGIPGVIGVKSYKNENSYTKRDLELLNFISAQVVLSIEKKVNEEKLNNQAARLQSIFDSSNHIIWSIDQDFRLTSFNQNFEYVMLENFNIKPIAETPLKGQNIFEKLPKQLRIFWREKFLAVMKGEVHNFEIKSEESKEQEIIWKEIFLNPIYSESGTIQGVSGIAHDITEKKRIALEILNSENRFRSIFESFQDIYFNCTLAGDIILISPSVQDMIGYSAQEVSGNNVTNYYLYTKKTKDLLKQLVEKRRVQNFEATLITIDGRLINCLCNVRLNRDKDTREVTIEGVARDITKLKQTNRELMHAKNIAENSLKVKERFLANMSHEIRTPMNGVIGMVDLLSQTLVNPEQQNYIQVIKRSSETLLTILNDILDLSKIEAGKMTIQLAVTQLALIFEKVLSLFTQQATLKNIQIEYDIDKSIPEYILFDETRILQILSNLLSNALKFTEKDGFVKLTACKETDENTFKISVIDTGIGISYDDQQKLFQSFTQVDNSSTKSFSGTGLGLAISKELSQLMGGEIGVHSEPHAGSIFWFTIKGKMPEKKAIANYLEEQKKSIIPYSFSLDKGAIAPYILIVDDNTINRQVASQILSKSGFRTAIASGGNAAIEKVKENDYDLILMDIQMPNIDGVTATKEIRKLPKKIPPIIAMTAYSMKEDRERFLSLGMDDYLAKPIISRILLEKISEHLKLYLQPQKAFIEATVEKETTVKSTELHLNTAIIKQLQKYVDDATIKSIFEEFEIEAQSLILDCIKAEKTTDITKILSNLHTLKGNAGTLGANKLEEQAKLLEAKLKEGNTVTLNKDLVDMFNYFNRFKENYQRIIN
ncbi:MAG: PAS domain S-box-containing protein [Marivirga sp.]